MTEADFTAEAIYYDMALCGTFTKDEAVRKSRAFVETANYRLGLRRAAALESIAVSLEKLANPLLFWEIKRDGTITVQTLRSKELGL